MVERRQDARKASRGRAGKEVFRIGHVLPRFWRTLGESLTFPDSSLENLAKNSLILSLGEESLPV